MINIKIKSIWQGKVGIRDKYIVDAFTNKKGLYLTYKDDFMIIPYEEIDRKLITPRIPVMVKDNYSGDVHQLFYFKWKPNKSQLELL